MVKIVILLWLMLVPKLYVYFFFYLWFSKLNKNRTTGNVILDVLSLTIAWEVWQQKKEKYYFWEVYTLVKVLLYTLIDVAGTM